MSTRALGLGHSLRKAAFGPSAGMWFCKEPTRIPDLLLSAQPGYAAQHRWKTVSSLWRNETSVLMKGTRSVQIQSLPASAEEQILNKQRIHRPSSPHFTIYQPQLTWLGSIANRVTGVGLSVCELMFAFSICGELCSREPRLFSAVWILDRLPDRAYYIQQRQCCGNHCGTSGGCEICWKGHPGCPIRFPLFQWSAPSGLGHGQVYVLYFCCAILHAHLALAV